MNAPAPKFLIESTWRNRLFGTEWREAAGGSIDVIEPATGDVLTRVGNATAQDIRRGAAEARKAQPAWAATPYEKRAAILRKAADLNPLDPDPLIFRSGVEAGLGDRGAALSDLHEALGREPDNFEARYLLARELSRADPAAARAELRRAHQLNPKDSAANLLEKQLNAR